MTFTHAVPVCDGATGLGFGLANAGAAVARTNMAAMAMTEDARFMMSPFGLWVGVSVPCREGL